WPGETRGAVRGAPGRRRRVLGVRGKTDCALGEAALRRPARRGRGRGAGRRRALAVDRRDASAARSRHAGSAGRRTRERRFDRRRRGRVGDGARRRAPAGGRAPADIAMTRAVLVICNRIPRWERESAIRTTTVLYVLTYPTHGKGDFS